MQDKYITKLSDLIWTAIQQNPTKTNVIDGILTFLNTHVALVFSCEDIVESVEDLDGIRLKVDEVQIKYQELLENDTLYECPELGRVYVLKDCVECWQCGENCSLPQLENKTIAQILDFVQKKMDLPLELPDGWVRSNDFDRVRDKGFEDTALIFCSQECVTEYYHNHKWYHRCIDDNKKKHTGVLTRCGVCDFFFCEEHGIKDEPICQYCCKAVDEPKKVKEI